MSRAVTRKFEINRRNARPISIEARNFKDLTDDSSKRHMARTEAVRGLRKGKAFFIEGGKNPDYHEKMHNLSRINVALEALRNTRDSEGDESCSLHIFENSNQAVFFSFPNGNAKREFAEKLNDAVFRAGAVLLISGNKARADS